MLILPRSPVVEAESKIWSILKSNSIIFFTIVQWGSDTSIVISARCGVCNSFFTKSYSGRFPFCLPHPDARMRVSIMTGLTQAKAYWRAREWKNFFYKISTISECLYRNRLLTSDLIGSFICPVRFCLYLFRTYVTNLLITEFLKFISGSTSELIDAEQHERLQNTDRVIIYVERGREKRRGGGSRLYPSARFVKSITLPIFIRWFVIE